MFRSLGALIGDLLVVVLFVAVGFVQHGTPLTMENIFLVGWPFLIGVLLGHLAIRAWRAPFRIWPHGVFVWAITLATAMAIRTLFSAGTEVSFIITTAIVTGVLMLGWRAVAMYLTRGERVRPVAVTGSPASTSENPARPSAESDRPAPAAVTDDAATSGTSAASRDDSTGSSARPE